MSGLKFRNKKSGKIDVCSCPENEKSSTDRGERRRLIDLTKDLEVVGEILSARWKTKIFIFIKKETKPNETKFISGYKLSHIGHVSSSTAYKFLQKMVEYGVFAYPTQIRDIKRVQITTYGDYIYEKIRHILPKMFDVL